MGENRQRLGRLILIILVLVLIFSRLAGLDWGLPYTMHPDERNMANAIERLNCNFSAKGGSASGGQFSNLRECLNPHFFAYGQLPLYLSFFLIKTAHFFKGNLNLPISFEEAVLSLRLLSAFASILSAWVILKIITSIISKKNSSHFNQDQFFNLLIIIFSPFFIQFSHFGTTESILMLFYSLIVYISIRVSKTGWNSTTVLFISLISGLAIATKLSSIIFIILPGGLFFYTFLSDKKASSISRLKIFLSRSFVFLILTFLLSLIFSPHNLISMGDFLGTFRYERDVALGALDVFYTRQFEYSIPILFQAAKIFPFVLGWPQFILAVGGFICLSWKDIRINILRAAFLIYFLSTAFLYAKWSRFTAPILPIITVFALLSLKAIYQFNQTKVKKILFFLTLFLIILPGMSYLTIYLSPDVRFTASKWIYENIPDKSYILSETANVVDMPIGSKLTKNINTLPQYTYISFNFYDVDTNSQLQDELQNHLKKADYIFVPSRRLFKNHDKKRYPRLAKYYNDLFTGKLRFKKEVEFTSFPALELFGKKIIEFPDEDAEETWTVFDHPVVRIYKRI